MPILISAQGISKSFGVRPLFENLSFSISSGERIGLIGPNGAGKSTLLSILAGRQEPDEGNLSVQKGLRVAYLEQVPKFTPEATVEGTVLEHSRDPHDWEEMARAQELMSKLSLKEGKVAELSGGWKKRVALARELFRNPDLLLLDEPTNHLDVESILWLEEFIAQSAFATLTITHDRVFLQRVSNRIIELDRRNPHGLLSVEGDYATFLSRKQALLTMQEASESKLRNTLRREEEWLRRGPKARTTKQQARIDRAGELQENVAELAYRNANRTLDLEVLGVGRSPKKLIEAAGISKSIAGQTIIPHTNILVTPKSRIGLLGPNGSGKSTLIRLLLKLEEPDTGSVFQSENLKVSYFEQNRESLDPTLSVAKTVCPLGEHLFYNGNRIHVRSYLDRFLFSGPQVEQPVGRLSGGEQSRLLLARLLLEPANLLVLDEPTNDLDMYTLDVLQEVLQDFAGAVLLVSHDRYFVDQVANQILAIGHNARGQKEIISFTNIDQWEEWFKLQTPVEAPKPQATVAPAKETPKKKFGFKEQRELEGMETTIAKAEARLAELTSESAKSEVVSNSTKLLEITSEMANLEKEIEQLFARWAELDTLKAESGK